MDDIPHAIIPGGRRFPPPKGLTAAERAHWTAIMNALPSGWFGPENLHLLQMLCSHLVVSDSALKVISRPMTDAMLYKQQLRLAEHADAMVLKISYQLRLTPKSRREVSYKKDETNRGANPIRPWEITIGDNGEDDDRAN
jgi:hypothetical protein